MKENCSELACHDHLVDGDGHGWHISWITYQLLQVKSDKVELSKGCSLNYCSTDFVTKSNKGHFQVLTAQGS